MKLAPFALERWFARYEFDVPHVLCASDCETMTVGELLALEFGSLARLEGVPLGYTDSAGTPALRSTIAGLYAGLAPEDVLVHVGAEEAIFTLMSALVGHGDEVVAVVPCYGSHTELPRALGAALVPWRILPGEEWRHDPAALERLLTPRTRLVVVTSPHNPTGALIGEADLRAIADLAADRGLHLLVDEVYRFLEPEGTARPPAGCELGPHVLSLGVMSKSFGLAGLRIGWLACQDRELLRRVAAVKDYTSICAPEPSQFLAEIALRHRDEIIGRTRRIVSDNMAHLRAFLDYHADLFAWVPPAAGPVVLPWFRDRRDAEPWCRQVAQEAGVLLAPGVMFGADPHHLRFGLGRRDMSAALGRLSEFIDEWEP